MIGHNRRANHDREPEKLRMNSEHNVRRWASLPQRMRGMFNLNDPRWGRGDDDAGSRPDSTRPSSEQPGNDRGGRDPKQGGQPPDLDELWRDLNRKLGSLFGGKNGSGRGPGGGAGGGSQDPAHGGQSTPAAREDLGRRTALQ